MVGTNFKYKLIMLVLWYALFTHHDDRIYFYYCVHPPAEPSLFYFLFFFVPTKTVFTNTRKSINLVPTTNRA